MRLESVIEKARLSELEEGEGTDKCVLVSYPDDEGVKNNGGRPGAHQGPESILNFLNRMPIREPMPKLYVLDEQLPFDAPLKERHSVAESWSHELYKKACRVITLGGGHDYAFPDISALWRTLGSCPVVNIDAHLDVRECDENRIGSGTAFRRLAENFKVCPIIQWGIQWSHNSKEHLEFCHSKKIPVIGLQESIELPSGNIGFSVCLDAFEGIQAVSAPSVYGLKVDSVMKTFEKRLQDVKYLGLYEVAPSLAPQTEDSARLAAQFAYRFIMREAFELESSLLR